MPVKSEIATTDVLLLAQIGDGGNHGGDARHAAAHTHHFGGGHLALHLSWDDNLAAGLNLGSVAYLGNLAVHVDDVCLALVGITGKTTCLVDVARDALALLVGYGVGVHHGSIDLHSAVVLWHYQAIALTQYHVGVAAWMLQSLG